MDTAPGNFNNPNATDAGLPESISQETVSENITSRNFSGNGSEQNFYDKVQVAFDISILVICTFGVLGNGIVFWLLIFRIQRNPFLTYILNLTIADLGVLLSVTVYLLSRWFSSISSLALFIVWTVLFFLFLLVTSSSQFLLTAISIDRFVAIFFPLWHQCKRPPRLSTIVCAVIWVFSFLLTVTSCTLCLNGLRIMCFYFQNTVNAALCGPVMTMATVALFIKVCFKAPQHRRGKLLTIILLTLLFFLFFAFPLNIAHILMGADYYLPLPLVQLTVLFSCLNSSVNPVIYFLVGRQWKSRQKESLRMILQKAFKEEDGGTGQQETPAETQL